MGDYLYENVPVAVKKSGDGSMYLVGIVVNGAFHAFGSYKVGGFDARNAEAQEQQQAQQQTQPVAPTV